jgi:NOL1/NOP2/fmu family ribosome biogenesis protein
MFVEQVVKQYVSEPVRALDLCAAPGGKSTHLLSALPQGSMLVSNEPMPLRAQILAENVTKWGNPTAVVTKNLPADFVSFKDFFDFILVDAPCSGEGMFRKEPKAVEQWSVSNVEMCAERQREILSDIWKSLRPGGLLVYSTCTFNSEENEQNVRWIAEELGAEVLELNVSPDWGITGSLADENLPVYRFIPGATDGEGFFLAVLRKDGEASLAQPRQPRLQKVPAKIMGEVESMVESPELFDFVQNDELITAMPKEHTSAMVALQQKLCVLHCGLPVATVKNNKLLPVHALAMSTSLRREAFTVVELELDRALMYLHRETLALQDYPIGHLLLTYRNVPIGFVKNVGNRANNLYPAEWRIRKNLMDL